MSSTTRRLSPWAIALPNLRRDLRQFQVLDRTGEHLVWALDSTDAIKEAQGEVIGCIDLGIYPQPEA